MSFRLSPDKLQPCGLTHEERAYGLEYNVVRRGETELLPEAGFAVYVQGENGKLAAARIYTNRGICRIRGAALGDKPASVDAPRVTHI